MGITPVNARYHISTLVSRVSQMKAGSSAGGAVNSAFSYRTVDSGENMVMLTPPRVMDRYQAENGYARQLPPIELKQKPEPEPQPAAKRKQTVVNAKSEPAEVRAVGSIDGMSREEINRLVDRVYEQLETRLLKERRRRGL